jgi:hypothetical protein
VLCIKAFLLLREYDLCNTQCVCFMISTVIMCIANSISVQEFESSGMDCSKCCISPDPEVTVRRSMVTRRSTFDANEAKSVVDKKKPASHQATAVDISSVSSIKSKFVGKDCFYSSIPFASSIKFCLCSTRRHCRLHAGCIWSYFGCQHLVVEC